MQCMNSKFICGNTDSNDIDKCKEEVYHYRIDKDQGLITKDSVPILNQSMRSKSIFEIPVIESDAFLASENKCPDLNETSKLSPIEGTTELPFMTVVHVMVNSGSKGNASKSLGELSSRPSVVEFGSTKPPASFNPNFVHGSDDVTEAFGVTCKWKMSPSSITRFVLLF